MLIEPASSELSLLLICGPGARAGLAVLGSARVAALLHACMRAADFTPLPRCRSVAESRSDEWQYQFSASVLEIYNEQIYDLLAGSREGGDKLEIKEGPGGVYVAGLMVKAVGSPQDVMRVSGRVVVGWWWRADRASCLLMQ